MFKLYDIEFNDIGIVLWYGILIIFIILLPLIMGSLDIKEKQNNKKLTIQDLLEFPQKYKFGKERVQEICKRNILYKRLKEFLENYKDYNFIVSLSGGVDSMLILELLMNLIDSDSISTASIDYNQRLESTAEINFVKRYLRTYKIKNYSKKVEGVSRKKENSRRKEFEETSQKIRYDLYREIITENNWDQNKTIIILGHHKDDLRENIFNNFILGRKLTDLEVMKEIVVKKDLIFGRPFLDYPKNEIYSVAHRYLIPYFKDTTPDWSKRGLMRRKLFPLLKEIYPNYERVLDQQGRNSCDLGELVKESCVDNFKYLIEEERGLNIISWNNDGIKNKLIWSERISNILHGLGKPMISQKSLKNFIENKGTKKYCVLSKFVEFRRTDDKTYLRIKK